MFLSYFLKYFLHYFMQKKMWHKKLQSCEKTTDVCNILYASKEKGFKSGVPGVGCSAAFLSLLIAAM